MTECYEAFERILDKGVTQSKESCEEVLPENFHFKKLKSLVQNKGIYTPPKGKKGSKAKQSKVNLNERLSKCMREAINPQFSKTFP